MDDVPNLNGLDDVEGLRRNLTELCQQATEETQRLLTENQLQLHPMEHLKMQVKTLVEWMCDDLTDAIRFDLAVQLNLQTEIQKVIEEMKAAEARARLTNGIEGMGNAVDLSGLRQGNRQQRRGAAKDLAKDLLRKGGGE